MYLECSYWYKGIASSQPTPIATLKLVLVLCVYWYLQSLQCLCSAYVHYLCLPYLFVSMVLPPRLGHCSDPTKPVLLPIKSFWNPWIKIIFLHPVLLSVVTNLDACEPNSNHFYLWTLCVCIHTLKNGDILYFCVSMIWENMLICCN